MTLDEAFEVANELLDDEVAFENTEYARAVAEFICVACGISPEAKDAVLTVLQGMKGWL